MNSMIKDLEINLGQINNAAGQFDRYTIHFAAKVIIKREGKYYAVPVRVSYDLTDEDNTTKLVEYMNHAFNAFTEQCDKCTANWVVQEESVIDGAYGKVILQEEIEL